MNPINKDQLNAFESALQLCIKGEVFVDYHSVSHQSSKTLTVTFSASKATDESVKHFTKIVDGKWLDNKQYQVLNIELVLSQEFINFMLITRLVKKNMIKMAEIDSAYEGYLHKLALKKTNESVFLNNLAQAKNIVFDHVKENKITFKELANKTDLTAMTLHNFKSGTDIKLSSFLKIVTALGLRVVIR